MSDFVEMTLVPVGALLPGGLLEGDGAREVRCMDITGTEGGKQE